MKSAVQTALDAVLGGLAFLKNANGAGRMFELFVMTGIAHRLTLHSYDVWLQRSDGTRVHASDADRQFVQRGGAPTGVPSSLAGPNNASTIGFRRPHGPAWEIWNGIQFRGRSGGLHELDLAIVPADVGRHLRGLSGGGVPEGRPRVAIECKDVGAPGSVDETRAFIARLYDLSLLEVHYNYGHLRTYPRKALHPGSPPGSVHDAAGTFRKENQRTMNLIVRRTGFVSGTAPLGGLYAIRAHPEVTAVGPNAQLLADSVADWIFTKGY